jgi:hypothetical protein
VLRQGEIAQLRYQGESRECRVAAGRHALGIAAEGDASVVAQLDVVRGAP